MWTDPVSAPIGEFVQRKKTMKSWIRYDYVRKMLDKKSNITSAGSLAGNSWRACTMKRTRNLWRARKEKKLNVKNMMWADPASAPIGEFERAPEHRPPLIGYITAIALSTSARIKPWACRLTIHSERQPSAQNRREAPPGTVIELLRATCKPRTKIGLEQWLQSSKQHVSSYVWMIYIYIIAMIAC